MFGGRTGPAHSNERKRLSFQCLTRAWRRSEKYHGLSVLHRFGLQTPICNPSFFGVVWPVQILHQSTPKPRARATSACLRCPLVACGVQLLSPQRQASAFALAQGEKLAGLVGEALPGGVPVFDGLIPSIPPPRPVPVPPRSAAVSRLPDSVLCSCHLALCRLRNLLPLIVRTVSRCTLILIFYAFY